MGLATAQARLLTITARKSDCEFLSMSYSHQKIALSRNMEQISTEYQNALNQTKLVYDYTGTNTSEMDLTYGLLMSPSVYNDYYPKLVTDSKNRVILNSSYAAAARAAGIPAEGLSGTPSSDVRNKFIEGLASAGVITSAKAVSIQGTTYSNVIGAGATTSATTSTTEVTYDQLLDLIDAKCSDTGSWTSASGENLVLDRSYAAGIAADDVYKQVHFTGYQNGKQVINSVGTTQASVSLSDLLKNDVQYNISAESCRGERTPFIQAAKLQEELVGTSENSASFVNWLTEQFTEVLGGTSASDMALQHAYNAIYDLLYPNSNLQEASTNFQTNSWGSASSIKHRTEPGDSSGIDGKTYNDIMSEVGTNFSEKLKDGYQSNNEKRAGSYIGFVYNSKKNPSGSSHKQTSEVAINLNSIAQVFLTAYVEYMQGLDNTNYSYNVGKKSDSNLYDGTKDDKFKFTIVSGSEVDTDKQVEANFYDALFNRICLDGWTENDQIEDKSYMQEMMKSGLIYISSIGDDGYYYQGNYSTDKYISEVKDDEAIAKAEAKYNTEKTKIENKEDTIDMKMKNLDTEISSLTTEYDTTKSVISKSIEKSFKRYDA